MTEAASASSKYEQAFARWLGVRHAFAFWKGRVALYAGLRAMGIGAGDEVIVPGYTCVVAVNPILYLGATPIFVDIEPTTFNVDVSQLEAHLTPRTKVIIAQHTYGYPVAMDAVLDVARRHGIEVVEDCCLALGSRWDGRKVGTFGRGAYFSFQWNKPYTSGLGGMFVTDDDALAEQVAALRRRDCAAPRFREAMLLGAQLAVHRALIYPKTTAAAQALFRRLTRAGLVVGSYTAGELAPAMEEGFFKGMSAPQQRAGLRGLRRVEDNIAHRRRTAREYDALLSQRGFETPTLPSEADPVLVRYPLRVADKAGALARASRRLVELGSWFESPLHPMETPLEPYGYRPGMCPEAERAAREVVNLPVHPRVGASTVRRTVSFVTEIGPPKVIASEATA